VRQGGPEPGVQVDRLPGCPAASWCGWGTIYQTLYEAAPQAGCGKADVMDKDFLCSFGLAGAYAQHLADHPAEFRALPGDRKK